MSNVRWAWPVVGASLLVAPFIASRVAFLDRDILPFRLTQLQPIDEFYYTIPAFNLFHHGALAHQVVPFIPTDGAPLNLLENVLTFLTLLVFGNNYYGLRMASVLAATGVFILLFQVLWRDGSVGPKTWVMRAIPFAALVYLVSDLPFNLAARAAEPTIFQMLAMVVVLFAVSTWQLKGSPSLRRAFALGFLGVAACVYVYVYNLFLIPAVAAMLIVEALPWGWRGVARQAATGAAGGVLAIISFAVVAYATYGRSLLDLYQLNIAPEGARVVTTSLPEAIRENVISIFTTNVFRFDLALLVAVAVALPVFAHRTAKERSSSGILVAALLIFLLLQSASTSDYSFRKLAIIDPLVVLVIAMAVPNIQPFAMALRSSRLAAGAMIIYLLVAAIGLYSLIRDQGPFIGPRFVVISAVCILTLVMSLAALRLQRIDRRILSALAVAAISLPGAAASAQLLYGGLAYQYRDAMVSAAPLLNGQVTAGELSYAFRLYNTSEPIINLYQYRYSASGLATYDAYMRRLFSLGISNRTVASPTSPTMPPDLGLHADVTYPIGAYQTPYVGVYRQTQS